jgi:hypothetical protein
MKTMPTFILSLLLLMSSQVFAAQLSGRLTDDKGDGLAFASIYVKNTSIGTSSNGDGYYQLDLKPGTWEVVFQYVGFKQVVKTVVMGSSAQVLNVSLQEEAIEIGEVVVTANGEDPAYAIIRKAIEQRKKHRDEVEAYTCDVYIKGIQRILNAPKMIMGQAVGDMDGNLDSTGRGIVYLSESVSKLSFMQPNKLYEEMISSKVSGNDNGFSYNSASAMDFSFYDNQIEIGRPLSSPISQMAMFTYDYKLEGAFLDEYGNLINKIKVTPKRSFDPAFSGYIYIVEGTWRIHSVDLIASAAATQIPVLDTLRFKQVFVPLDKGVWRLFSQSIDFNIGLLGFKIGGNFSGVYTNYAINPTIDPKLFKGGAIFKVAEESNTKDSTYWTSIRPIPLTWEERVDYTIKDSLQTVRSTKSYMDSVDRASNKFTPLDLISGYTWRNSHKKQSFSIASPLNNIDFNTIQGYNLSLMMRYRQDFKSNDMNWFELTPNFQYGFSDRNFYGWLDYEHHFNRTHNDVLKLSAGRKASQFNPDEPITRNLNSIYTLLWRQNHLKMYDRIYGEISYGREWFNGFNASISLDYSQRRALRNTNFSAWNNDATAGYTSNDPQQPNDESSSFSPYEAFTVGVDMSYQPFQKYILYPGRKINIGSAWPTLSLGWRRGLPLLGGDSDYDLFTAGISYDIPMKLLGTSKIVAKGGIFLNAKALPFIDYQHFNGNQTIFTGPKAYAASFQMLPYYTYSSSDKWVELHYQHYFENFIFNKIPLVRKLGWHTVAGLRGLYLPGQSPYLEVNVGIDNIGWGIFRFFRVDWVGSTGLGNSWKNGIRIGINLPIR